MSSSPSRARVLPVPVAPAIDRSAVSAFLYREVASPTGEQRFPLSNPTSIVKRTSGADAGDVFEAREAGRLQGELETRAKLESQLVEERSAVARTVADFSRERAAYYQKIEEEAVQLALSIARKILHREAQVDPLLLMGIVRVAFDRMEGAAAVTLAVHPTQAAAWRDYVAAHMENGPRPEIVEVATLAPGQCELRTSMGTAALGVEVQLKEIELGLMDLLAARPKGKE